MDTALKQRLLGAAIVIGAAVIVLPFLLDGDGASKNTERSEAVRVDGVEPAPRQRITINEEGISSAAGESVGSAQTTPSNTATPSAAPEVSRPPITALSPAPETNTTQRSNSNSASNGNSANTKAPSSSTSSTQNNAPATQQAATTRPAVQSQPTAQLSTGWSVQVGSFAVRANAQRLEKKLKTAGYEAYIAQAQTANGPRYRVRVGPFAGQQEARQKQPGVNRVTGGSSAVLRQD